MSEIVLRASAESVELSVDEVRKFIAPNATEKELFMFMGICRSFGLNPFKREIHFIKYKDGPASIVVGYEEYLKRAERTGNLDGWKCWIETDEIGEKAVIEIHRKDQNIPIKWEVYRKEFDRGQSTWKTMGTFMLKKVVISQGFRLAFPDDLGGMPYIPEEIPISGGDMSSEHLSQMEEPRPVKVKEPAPVSEPEVVEAEVVKDEAPKIPATDPQINAITAMLGRLKIDDDKQKMTLVSALAGLPSHEKFLSLKGLSKTQASMVIENLNEEIKNV